MCDFCHCKVGAGAAILHLIMSENIPHGSYSVRRQKRRRHAVRIAWSLWFVIIVLVIIQPWLFPSGSTQEISTQQLVQDILPRQQVSKILIIDNSQADIYLQPPALVHKGTAGPQYKIILGSSDSFERQLQAAEIRLFNRETIPVFYTRSWTWLRVLLIFGSLLLIILFFQRDHNLVSQITIRDVGYQGKENH